MPNTGLCSWRKKAFICYIMVTGQRFLLTLSVLDSNLNKKGEKLPEELSTEHCIGNNRFGSPCSSPYLVNDFVIIQIILWKPDTISTAVLRIYWDNVNGAHSKHSMNIISFSSTALTPYTYPLPPTYFNARLNCHIRENRYAHSHSDAKVRDPENSEV